MAGPYPLKGRWRSLSLPLIFTAVALPAVGQHPGSGEEAGMTEAELSLLDEKDNRNRMSCRFGLVKPRIGYDFRFHSGFEASVPVRKIRDSEELTLFYRVRSADPEVPPLYYREVTPIPKGLSDRSYVVFEGSFQTGEGVYRLDVGLAGSAGTVCTEHYELESRRSRKGRDMPVTLERDALSWGGFEIGDVVPEIDEPRPGTLHLLVNVPPFPNSRRPLSGRDVAYFVHILKYVAERSPLESIRLTAFNLKDQQVLFSQSTRPWLQLSDFANSLGGVASDQVSVASLREDGVRDFMTNLANREVRGSEAEAVIFLGPVGFRGDRLKELGEQLEDHVPPLYYVRFRYRSLSPAFGDPIKDLVGKAGGKTYEVGEPYDLWKALNEIMGRLESAS